MHKNFLGCSFFLALCLFKNVPLIAEQPNTELTQEEFEHALVQLDKKLLTSSNPLQNFLQEQDELSQKMEKTRESVKKRIRRHIHGTLREKSAEKARKSWDSFYSEVVNDLAKKYQQFFKKKYRKIDKLCSSVIQYIRVLENLMQEMHPLFRDEFSTESVRSKNKMCFDIFYIQYNANSESRFTKMKVEAHKQKELQSNYKGDFFNFDCSLKEIDQKIGTMCYWIHRLSEEISRVEKLQEFLLPRSQFLPERRFLEFYFPKNSNAEKYYFFII